MYLQVSNIVEPYDAMQLMGHGSGEERAVILGFPTGTSYTGISELSIL